MREGEDDVVRVDHAKVAVDGTRGIEHVGARAGRIERAGDLLPDVSRLAGAGNGDASGTLKDQVDGLKERVAQPAGDFFQGAGLGADELPGVVEPVRRLADREEGVNL